MGGERTTLCRPLPGARRSIEVDEVGQVEAQAGKLGGYQIAVVKVEHARCCALEERLVQRCTRA